MTNPEAKQDSFALNILASAKVYAYFLEDLARALLGFVPNGLNLLYDFVFKSLPLFGKFFAHRWVEQVIKLCTGITIGQGLAGDLAYYLFRPLGFVLGLVIASIFKKVPQYQGEIGKWLYRLSAQTVGGALFGIACLLLASYFIQTVSLNMNTILFASLVGASLGLIAKVILMIAIHSVHNANALGARKNAQKAKELNAKLKSAAKLKAKSIILMQAQDIIQQMNGPQSQQFLESFFEEEYEGIANKIYQKLDRHFNYLADRAIHGDVSSLKRMQDLIPKSTNLQQGAKHPFEILVERMFNARTLFNLKDDVDTAYDRWQYRFLKVAN